MRYGILLVGGACLYICIGPVRIYPTLFGLAWVTLLLVQGLLLPALLLPGPDRTAVGQGGIRPIPEPAGRRYRVRVRRTTHTERP